MSPARKAQAHDAPARRRRPPATHDTDDAPQEEQSADEAPDDEAADDEPEGDEPEGNEPEGDEPEGDEPEGDEPEGDEPPDDEAPDDEPDDEPEDDDLPEDEDEGEDDAPEDDGLPADEDVGEDDAQDEPSEDDEPSGPEPSGGLDAQGAARRAVRHLKELSHHRPEGVVGIERDDEGWTVTVEVLEDAHVPSTSDVLAEYEVRLDADGGLRGVTRGRRYVRGRTER